MVLPLNGNGSASLKLIYVQFLLADGAHAGDIAGIIYIGIEYNSVDSPVCKFAIIA